MKKTFLISILGVILLSFTTILTVKASLHYYHVDVTVLNAAYAGTDRVLLYTNVNGTIEYEWLYLDGNDHAISSCLLDGTIVHLLFEEIDGYDIYIVSGDINGKINGEDFVSVVTYQIREDDNDE